MLFRKITHPKITDAAGQHVGLRGAGAAACTELSVHTPERTGGKAGHAVNPLS